MLLGAAMMTGIARAAELTPFVNDGALGARLHDLEFPEDFPKELTSGLTRRVLVRVELLAPERAPSRRIVEMTVKYDLWDETFRFTLSVDTRLALQETHASLPTVLARLQDARLPALFATGGLPQDVPHTLRAEVLLNPIDSERMEEIRKWVAQNSTNAPNPSGPSGGLGSASGSAATNPLLNRIFEQYTTGVGAASWRALVVSRPFSLPAVAQERP
jgi:hypothetical protein